MVAVNVIYHFYPHYRRPVLRELARSPLHEYRFWGALEGSDGVEPFRGDERVKIHPLRYRRRGRWWLVGGYLPAVLDPSADVLVVHGHPNMPASWIIGLLGRATRKKVIYWAHGWLRTEGRLRAVVRRLHYRLADLTLTYADRARELAAAAGYPAELVAPIYNSLDWEAARAIAGRLEAEGRDSVRRRLGIGARTFRIVCVGRLIEPCRFDLLLRAVAAISSGSGDVEIAIIGDGPARVALERLAGALGVRAAFAGAAYDEAVLGEQIFASDVSVYPGKAGLSCIHSMMYGVPVITHGDLDRQMPEVEAVVPGETGALFAHGDADDLARVLRQWMAGWDRTGVSRRCREMIETRYNPAAQALAIDAAITRVVGGGRQ